MRIYTLAMERHFSNTVTKFFRASSGRLMTVSTNPKPEFLGIMQSHLVGRDCPYGIMASYRPSRVAMGTIFNCA